MSGSASSDILIAGAIAAFTVDLLVYPLDTLKTRMQSPDYAKLYVDVANGAVNKAKLFRGLYQGVGSVIIATLPASGAFFTTYEHTKTLLHSHPILPAPLIHATASSLAELVSCAILTPAEVIKQNAQMVNASSTSSAAGATIQTLRKFQKHPAALWRGYTVLAGRNLPFTALQFPLFEHMRVAIRRYRNTERRTGGSGAGTGYGKAAGPASRTTKETLLESGLVTGISAGLAGSLAAVLTTPVDVVKTRVMLSAADERPPTSKHTTYSTTIKKKSSQKVGDGGVVDAFGKRKGVKSKKSVWDVTNEIVKEKGWRGLWRGGALRGIWTMLGSGLYLGTYEAGRIWLGERRGDVEGDDL